MLSVYHELHKHVDTQKVMDHAEPGSIDKFFNNATGHSACPSEAKLNCYGTKSRYP